MKEIAPDKIDDQVKALATCLTTGGNEKRLQTLAAKNAEGLLKPRIFNDGKAADGATLSAYSPEYAKKRAKAGRQTGRKDLQFSGKLFDSIQVQEIKGDVVLGFTPGRRSDAKISNAFLGEALEQQENKDIFILGNEEQKQVIKVMDKAVTDMLDECFNRF